MKLVSRGQGSIEYLMILAAVLAIAVVVVVLATTFFMGYKEPAEVAQDKSVCIASNIELVNYVRRYPTPDASFGSKIRYFGQQLNCNVLASPGPADTGCKIGLSGSDQCMQIYASDAYGCEIQTLPVDC